MKRKYQQNGSVLVLVLVLLAIMSVIVISASQNTSLQLKMTSNLRDKQIARLSAYSTMREIEQHITALPLDELLDKFENEPGYYLYNKDRVLNQQSGWKDIVPGRGSIAYSAITTPLYLIELLPPLNNSDDSLESNQVVSERFFRVSVLAHGGTNVSSLFVQSIVQR